MEAGFGHTYSWRDTLFATLEAKAVVPPTRSRQWWKTSRYESQWSAPARPEAEWMGTDLSPRKTCLRPLREDPGRPCSTPGSSFTPAGSGTSRRCHAFPVDEHKLVRVASLFKAGGHRSFKNYLSRAKDQRLALGYEWTETLHRVSQRCTCSVLRGLAGKSRSEAFNFLEVHKALTTTPGTLARAGPVSPRPMIVCATYFMLRELEVSALDIADVVLSDNSVSPRLPVSKTDERVQTHLGLHLRQAIALSFPYSAALFGKADSEGGRACALQSDVTIRIELVASVKWGEQYVCVGGEAPTRLLIWRVPCQKRGFPTNRDTPPIHKSGVISMGSTLIIR